MKKPSGGWRNRIIGEDDIAPDQLLANPLNWRIHPKFQQDTLRGVLNDVGWVQRVIVNKTTGNIVDGHLRVSLALRHGAETVPVVFVELTEEEENEILATIDPISAMAGTDKQKLGELMQFVSAQDQNVREMLIALSQQNNPNYAENNGNGGDFDTDENELSSAYSDAPVDVGAEKQQASNLGIGIWKPKWNKMRTVRFFSLRVWNSRDKRNEIDRMKRIKKECFPEAVENIAQEIFTTITETFQHLPEFIVTNAPRGHASVENHLATLVSQKVASKLNKPYERIFIDRALGGTTHPKNFSKRGTISTSGMPSGKNIILIDDIASSGVTIEQCVNTLAENFVIPIVWVYENSDKPNLAGRE